jgi:hypothetical protein
MRDLSKITIEDFQKYKGHHFTIRFTPEVELSAELMEISELKQYSKTERIPFSVIFRTGQKNEYYPQATFILIDPESGEMPLFMVPIGPDQNGMRYEAIFY